MPVPVWRTVFRVWQGWAAASPSNKLDTVLPTTVEKGETTSGKKIVASACCRRIRSYLTINKLVWCRCSPSTVGMFAVYALYAYVCMVCGLSQLPEKQLTNNAHLFIMTITFGILMKLILIVVYFCNGSRNNPYWLISFFGLMVVVVVALSASAAWHITICERLRFLAESSVIDIVKSDDWKNDLRNQIVDDGVQSHFGPCDTFGPTDWAGWNFSQRIAWQCLCVGVTIDSNNSYELPIKCCTVKRYNSEGCNVVRKEEIYDVNEICTLIYMKGLSTKGIATLKTPPFIGIGILTLLGIIFLIISFRVDGSSDLYEV